MNKWKPNKDIFGSFLTSSTSFWDIWCFILKLPAKAVLGQTDQKFWYKYTPIVIIQKNMVSLQKLFGGYIASKTLAFKKSKIASKNVKKICISLKANVAMPTNSFWKHKSASIKTNKVGNKLSKIYTNKKLIIFFHSSFFSVPLHI